MKPEDDAKWISCEHPGERHWCPQVGILMKEGHDAQFIEPGLNYCIPVFPADNLYAEVSIDREWLIPDVCANIYLVGYQPQFVTDPGEMIPLGLWNRGEGRYIISRALDEWVQANADDKCHANAHGFAEEIEYQKQVAAGAGNVHRWCLAYYKMCFVCRTKAITPAPSASGVGGNGGVFGSAMHQSVQQFNAASFGLGSDNFTPARNQGNASDGQAARTRNLLAMRNKK